ncbi:MAG: RNA polymerase sigma factor [Planctomycetes bacterium]|nr:RNA polymerase sigma factor [Planctomycetota bacterium]
MVSPTDAELVQRARAGDRSAFGALASRHGARVVRYLTTMTGDDAAAEDLRQEALRLALERLDQLTDPGRFGAWLMAIATNRCRNHLRDVAQRRATGGDEQPDVADAGRRSALSSIVARESAVAVALAVDRLPILLREAFVLFCVEQLDYRTIAEITGARENTLQVRVHRAKALLRQQLGSVVDTFWQRRET